MAKVFISYSRKDIDFAKQLTSELQKGDLDFWIDWEGIPPTVDWWREIEKGIEEADIFIFLISPDSVKSKVCGQEIDAAVKNGKRIVPIVVREIEWEDTPPQLGHLNYIFFSREDDFDTAIRKLLTAIHTDYEWAATHRRLQVKALDWERNNKEKGFLLRGKDLQDAEHDLATNTSKSPHPTDLQREYVFESRKATDKQRRTVTGISIAGVIALAALAVFGFVQAGLATSNERKAVNNAATAEANLIVAQTARADANNNEAIAIANAEEAKRQASIALARQLAAQAKNIFDNDQSNQTLAVLLATQSMKLEPNTDAAQILLRSKLAQSIAIIPVNGDVKFDFGQTGPFTVSGMVQGASREWEIVPGFETYYSDINSFLSYESPTGEYTVEFDPIDKFIVARDIETYREIAYMSHDDRVNSVGFTMDGAVASGGCDERDFFFECRKGSIRIWKIGGEAEIAHVEHGVRANTVTFSPDGTLALSAGCDETNPSNYCLEGVYRLWETDSGREVASIVANDLEVKNSAFSPDSKFIALGTYAYDSNPVTILWNLETGQINYLTGGDFVFSSDGARIVTITGGNASENIPGEILLWDLTTEIESSTLGSLCCPTTVAASLDGQLIAVGTSEGNIVILNIDTLQIVSQMAHNDEINSIAFSPDSKRIVSGSGNLIALSQDTSARVWDVFTGEEISSFVYDTPDVEVSHVVFSPDGRYVASSTGGSYNNTVTIWDADTGDEIAVMIHENGSTSAAFSPDGTYIVSGGDMTARVWETLTGRELARMTHYDFVKSVSFSPDGKLVASGGDDGIARVWMWQAEDLISNACFRLPRNMTAAEWKQYIGDTLPPQAVCDNLPFEADDLLTSVP